MQTIVDIAKALSDPGRVRALMLLRDGTLCVCQIIEILGLAPSTVSKHMSILRQAGLVESEKRGRWMYYRLVGKTAPKEAQQALKWLIAGLDDDPGVQRDMDKLQKILKIDKEQLCRMQRDGKCC